MVCLGLEPRAAGWKAQMNPPSYGSTPSCHGEMDGNVLTVFLFIECRSAMLCCVQFIHQCVSERVRERRQCHQKYNEKRTTFAKELMSYTKFSIAVTLLCLK